jgi:hypothetical protein
VQPNLVKPWMSRHTGAKRPGAEDDSFFAYDRASESAVTLLIMDCETRRFAIVGPVERLASYRWIDEIERAERAGRNIFWVPVADREGAEITNLVAALGYQEWPPATIVCLPPEEREPAHPR